MLRILFLMQHHIPIPHVLLCYTKISVQGTKHMQGYAPNLRVYVAAAHKTCKIDPKLWHRANSCCVDCCWWQDAGGFLWLIHIKCSGTNQLSFSLFRESNDVSYKHLREFPSFIYWGVGAPTQWLRTWFKCNIKCINLTNCTVISHKNTANALGELWAPDILHIFTFSSSYL